MACIAVFLSWQCCAIVGSAVKVLESWETDMVTEGLFYFVHNVTGIFIFLYIK